MGSFPDETNEINLVNLGNIPFGCVRLVGALPQVILKRYPAKKNLLVLSFNGTILSYNACSSTKQSHRQPLVP